MPTTLCPATMCPLFARDGSPHSGQQDAPCSTECGWHDGQGCRAARIATGEVALATNDPRIPWPRLAEPHCGRRSFDCLRAAECTWQRQQPGGLCPPRRALAHGLDPRRCA